MVDVGPQPVNGTIAVGLVGDSGQVREVAGESKSLIGLAAPSSAYSFGA